MSNDNRQQPNPSQTQAANKVASAAVATIKGAGNVLTPKELQGIIDDMKKGQATKNKILDWLLGNVAIQFMRPMLFHLTDVCDEHEMGACIDYIAAKMPRDASYVESYRPQMIELVGARSRTPAVKEASLALFASQGQ